MDHHDIPAPVATVPPTSARHRVLTWLGHVELIRTILSYALFGTNMYTVINNTDVVDGWVDAMLDEDVEKLSGQLTTMKDVHSLWRSQIESMTSSFAVIRVGEGTEAGLEEGPASRAQRILVDTKKMSLGNIAYLSTFIARFPRASRLHFRARYWNHKDNSIEERELEQWITGVLQNGKLNVLRWNGPPIDVLKLSSSSTLSAIILDVVPEIVNWGDESISFPALKDLTVMLTDNWGRRGPSNIFQALCRASAPLLQSLSTSSALEFPHVLEFITQHANTLKTVMVKERLRSTTTELGPLPSMRSLRTCTLNISSFEEMLKGERRFECLTTIELFGFNERGLMDDNLRRSLSTRLMEIAKSIVKRREKTFSSVVVLKLLALSRDAFRNARWSLFEETCMGYAFFALKKVGIAMIGEEDFRLHPEEMFNRQLRHWLLYRQPVNWLEDIFSDVAR